MLGCVVMDMKIVKWDKSMAVRCIERAGKGYSPKYQHEVKSINKKLQDAGWEQFEYAINKALAKKHK